MESREPNYGNRIEQILGSVTGDYTGELDAPSARIEYLVKKIKANIATGASDEDIKVAITDALKDYVKRSDVQPDTNTTYTFKQDETDPNKFIFEGSDGTKASVNVPKTTVPTKVSELENDAEFVTKADLEPDFANCAKKADLPDLTPYAKKTDIPAEPDLSDYAKKSDIPPMPDWTKFASKDEIPTVPENVSAFKNDAGYLTEHQSLDDYAKKTDLPIVPTKVSELENDANYAKKSDIPASPDLTPYALKEDIPTVPENVSAFTNDAGYLTEHQDLTDYAKKSDIPAAPDLTPYATKDELQTKVNNSEASEALDAHKALETKEASYPQVEVTDTIPTEKDGHKVFFKKEGDKWVGYTYSDMTGKYSSFAELTTDPSQYSSTDLAVMMLWNAIFG